MTTKLRELLGVVRQVDRKWQKQVAVPEMYTPWMPADVAQYLVLLIEAVAEAPGEKFLEIGCGPGTKMLLARDALADMLDVSGFDRVPEYVEAARDLGLDAVVCDAFDYPSYGRADIVFFNRPFRDRDTQRDLERLVYSKIRRGAVVICMNLENKPPADKFLVITDDWEEGRRGVWLKL
jgi:trans-aconitate methyltransferase